jgi:hypothetical protein
MYKNIGRQNAVKQKGVLVLVQLQCMSRDREGGGSLIQGQD